ncbi:uncharacterized protein LOC135132433 [Zophobas morio]|uniref:uncharacterized protein LOC135132433 n=1 Tax=Zophobas morio TaxID=2755281 RepID=UPI003083C358
MDLYTLISTGLDDKLKCSLCKNYLSHFPISIYSNNQNICGRCPIPEGTVYHEEALETLCHLLRFPCRYQSEGCSQQLYPKEVPQHEENCPFRIVKCVMTKPTPCSWSGNLPTLPSHLQADHAASFLKNGEFKVDVSRSEECDFLMQCEKKVVVCTKKFETGSNTLDLVLDAPYHGLDEDGSWQVSVKRGKVVLFHDLELNDVEKKLCAKLLVHSVVEERSEEPLLCQIRNISNTMKGEISDLNVASDVFRCGVCHNVATPPIFRCPYDMSIKCASCDELCHPSLSCPTSKKDDKLSRLIKLVNFQCKYQKYGCTFGALLKEVKRHESLCCYRSEKCPLSKHQNCRWQGLVGDAKDHIVSQHPDSFCTANSEFKVSLEDTAVIPKFIHVCDCLFKFYCFTRDNCYVWSVQTVFEEKEAFMYEVDVVDGAKNGQRFTIRKPCVKNIEDVFQDMSACCFVLQNQVSSMTEQSEEETFLTYKIGIFK